MRQNLQELVPVRKIKDPLLRLAQGLELFGPQLLGDFASLEILAPPAVVDLLQPTTPESKPHSGSQHLVGTGI